MPEKVSAALNITSTTIPQTPKFRKKSNDIQHKALKNLYHLCTRFCMVLRTWHFQRNGEQLRKLI